MRLCELSLVLLLAGLGACASAGGERPRVPPGVPSEFLHFTDSHVSVGDLAPDFTLPDADGEGETQLSSLRGRPVVLVFGSYT